MGVTPYGKQTFMTEGHPFKFCIESARGYRVKKIRAIFFIVVVAVAGYAAFSWFTARNEVREYCSGLKAGTDVATMKSLAASRGLRLVSPNRADGQGRFTALVTSSGTMGRYVCTVEHDGSKVIGTRLDFHD